MNITYIKLVFIIVALLLTFSTVYMNSHTVSWEQHEMQLEELQEIRILDALSNQEMLKVRYQLYYDYDLLTEYTYDVGDRLRRVCARGGSPEPECHPGQNKDEDSRRPSRSSEPKTPGFPINRCISSTVAPISLGLNPHLSHLKSLSDKAPCTMIAQSTIILSNLSWG